MSARFAAFELPEPHRQGLFRRHLAVAVFLDQDELLRGGQAGGDHQLAALPTAPIAQTSPVRAFRRSSRSSPLNDSSLKSTVAFGEGCVAKTRR